MPVRAELSVSAGAEPSVSARAAEPVLAPAAERVFAQAEQAVSAQAKQERPQGPPQTLQPALRPWQQAPQPWAGVRFFSECNPRRRGRMPEPGKGIFSWEELKLIFPARQYELNGLRAWRDLRRRE